ncbi:hypothetical protein GGQ68_004580 [Sagittula marina]|uniref:Uncharacterized protein n=1 Tax=Sagittula marina TaxID=943940 RepID=A0A7W6DSX3_9RHOB|nr:hypothetical protein [Sagittula marina]MBB3988224.1 hypothetical protein [Sagittula marina]
MDKASAKADRRCPECDAVQPIFIGKQGSKRVWQRSGTDVLPCPECDTPLRLQSDPRDPKGMIGTVGMVMLIAVGLALTYWLRAQFDLGALALGGMLFVVVTLGMAFGSLWTTWSMRRRPVVKA